MEERYVKQASIDVRNVDSAIVGSVTQFPKSLGIVLDGIVLLYAAYSLFAWIAGGKQLVQLALEKTDGYRPLAWVIGLVTGIALTHVYNVRIAPNVRAVRKQQEKFDEAQESTWWNAFSIGVFVVAVAAGIAEVLLISFGGTTLSREVFDFANSPAGRGAYHWAGLATGIMVVASLLGSRLNAWYRLSLLVLSMVSAHIFWHLSYDAYASVHQSIRAESANVGP